ncbi:MULTISPECIES: acyl carrier protein [Eubacterium]|uniref:Acyl carrier protein n=1 Tax=Eubacterium ruminantium TaxID=42322 RepID=A0A1T4PPX8_9FIRM|nr:MULTISPECIES: acyl carrier protein [Eubacterium]MCR5367126.1 acyl carrier protein [Eubacterium sp.]SCW61050.1 acyl carrier protein [Eubacterium ruminantium]SDN17514.1 acyl carrier protein [Eubacterium ruminantium]SJZ92928.1 acyl carrier protein [Eubacterium ruminantium]
MDKDQIEKKLADLITEVMPEVEEVDYNALIEQEYGVNSVSIIRLIVETENEFNVKFTDYELALDNYATFMDLVDRIYEKLDV